MSSIIAGAFDKTFFTEEDSLIASMKWLKQNYPFIDLIFTLDPQGIQLSANVMAKSVNDKRPKLGKGTDRSYRPYYIQACEEQEQSIVVTEGEIVGIVVLDIDLAHAIEFLMGDNKRKRFQPFFISVYSCIVIGLFFIVGILLYSAGNEIVSLLIDPSIEGLHSKPFGIIIFLTLALAIFDLGKTTMEEEVLMQKDIFRHSSTRRTITRFMATILIAISIEALLLMFKSVLGNPQYLVNAVAMMAASAGLLVGLGIYVYLGAKAEVLLKGNMLHKQG